MCIQAESQRKKGKFGGASLSWTSLADLLLSAARRTYLLTVVMQRDESGEVLAGIKQRLEHGDC